MPETAQSSQAEKRSDSRDTRSHTTVRISALCKLCDGDVVRSWRRRGGRGQRWGLRAGASGEYAACVLGSLRRVRSGLRIVRRGLAMLAFGAACGGHESPVALGRDAKRAPFPRTAPRCFEGPLPGGVRPRLASFCASSAGRRKRAAGPFPMSEAGCSPLLGPGCAYRYHGLREIVLVPFVDPAGSGGEMELSILRFDSAEHSHAAFTALVLGESDAAELQAQALDDSGLSVWVEDRALAFRGRALAVLEYTNERETLAERKRSGARRLGLAVDDLDELFPSPAKLPEAALRLPVAHRTLLGVRTFVDDALGVAGLGHGAQGHHRDGPRRWRTLAIVRPDADSAQDVMTTLRRHADCRPIRWAPLGALSFVEHRGSRKAPVEWVVGRRGRVVYGVGDETRVIARPASNTEHAPTTLTEAQKLSLLVEMHRG